MATLRVPVRREHSLSVTSPCARILLMMRDYAISMHGSLSTIAHFASTTKLREAVGHVTVRNPALEAETGSAPFRRSSMDGSICNRASYVSGSLRMRSNLAERC